jgi:hypothetical protein
MSLSDIFTPSVVISLAISLLLIGLLGLYVNNKMNEQNHKLNTMFDLVSTLANELQMVRSQAPIGMGSPSIGGGRMYEKPEVGNTTHLVNMIDVSDDSESSGDESDGDTDEGAESDDNSGDEGDGEEESGSDGEDDETDGDSECDGDDGENDARSDKAIVVSESLDDALFEELANLDEIMLDDTKDYLVKTQKDTTINTNMSSVKNLNVVFDYKKASLSKLREIVEQKGLSSDTSKLKKQELLKMLEID